MTDPTINTLEAPGEFDALPKLRPGEPYFALLGRDAKAPPLILTWAWAQREAAAGLPEGDAREEELRQATQAEEVAWAMDDYREGVAAQAAPEPQAAKPYTGFELDADTLERDRQHSSRVRAPTAVSRAYSELADEAEIIERNDPYLAAAIRDEVRRLREFHEIVSVKRPIIDQQTKDEA